MTARPPTWACALLLNLAACQPADELQEVTERLQATDEQLAAIETKLAAIETKLDSTTSELEALRAQPRGPRTLTSEAGLRPDLVDPLAAPPVPSPIDGAENVECEGLETPNIECKVGRAFMTSLFDNPNSLVKQARIVPSVQDGKTRGYKLYGIRPTSLPKLVGMKNGDTITSLGGKPLDSLDSVMEAYAGLPASDQIVLGIERKAAAIVLTINIVE